MPQASQTFDPKVGDKVKLLRPENSPSEFWWGRECEVVKILEDGLATVKLVNFPGHFPVHKETNWPCRYMIPHDKHVYGNPIGEALLDAMPGLPKESLNMILEFNFGNPKPMYTPVPVDPVEALEALRRRIFNKIQGNRHKVFAMINILMDDQEHNQAELAQAVRYKRFPQSQRNNFRIFQKFGLVNVPAPGRYIITDQGKSVLLPML